ncbi:barstar family protein [Nocardia sp. CC227C]|uniref:barstar family protein n=1 Tax=Nocardia sp. CC227C TaxID=3044562 RepID=UPI00278BFAD5|nr:barstar family protein [Nocardia sp. CC227C]
MPRPIPLSQFLSAAADRTQSPAQRARDAGVTKPGDGPAPGRGAAEPPGEVAGVPPASDADGSGADEAGRTGAAEPNSASAFERADAAGRAGAGARSPVLGALDVSAPEFGGVRYAVPDGYVAREVRGRSMRTVAGVLDEFAAALQFPYYFGGNLDAFDDSLRDLDDCLGTARGYVIAVRDADELLADAPAQRSWFDSAMSDAADYWAARGVVFRVLLQGVAPADMSAARLSFDTGDADAAR